MHLRDIPECARTFVSDAYATARHYAGKADDMILKGANIYAAASPLVAAGMDAYGASDSTKMMAKQLRELLTNP